MTWWGWVIFGSYYACALVALRKIAWVIANDMSYNGRLAGDDVLFGLFMGAVVCSLWPLLWIGYLIHQREEKPNWGGLLSPPRHVRRALELDERERRIRQLEREAGFS